VNKPVVTEGIGFINYAWPELGLRVFVEHYNSDGHADLDFFLKNETGENLIHTTWANLRATPTMNSLARRLKENSADIPWVDILTYIAGKTKEIARQGEPVQEIWASEEDKLTPSYLLEPILYLNHPTVIFGDYGSLKSLFGLVIGYVAQLPYSDNKLGLITGKESTHCLYLDYEDEPLSFRRRWSAIEKGFGLKAPMPILYRRMVNTLADSVERLQQIIVDKNIKLLIIDSLGPAARGNLNDPEPAIRYHEALRRLGITSLTLAHNSKDPLTRKRTIFGSVFFTNLARSVWECKAEQETGENEAIISVKHTKANLSRLHPPLGYRFTFTDNSIAIAKTDLKDTGLSGELPVRWRIKDALRERAMTIQELAERLGTSPDTVGRTVRRMRSKTEVMKLEDDRWSLAS
jgi:hypothetical protein